MPSRCRTLTGLMQGDGPLLSGAGRSGRGGGVRHSPSSWPIAGPARWCRPSRRWHRCAVRCSSMRSCPHPGAAWFSGVPEPLAARLRGLAKAGKLPPWHAWWPKGAMEALLPDRTLGAAFIAEQAEVPLAYLDEVAPAIPLTTPSALSAIERRLWRRCRRRGSGGLAGVAADPQPSGDAHPSGRGRGRDRAIGRRLLTGGRWRLSGGGALRPPALLRFPGSRHPFRRDSPCRRGRRPRPGRPPCNSISQTRLPLSTVSIDMKD